MMRGYIDLHCDTLWEGVRQNSTITELKGSMLDVQRLCEAGVIAQCFAMFLPQKREVGWSVSEEKNDLDDMLERLYGVYTATLKENSDRMAAVSTYQDLEDHAKQGLLSGILTIENGEILYGDLQRIQMVYDMGVRLISLTWNDPNCLGQNHSPDPELMQRGLTAFGKEAVACMNELGIIVDVSHLSDGGFYDVADVSNKPFVASHSNCRSLTPHTRNMTDDMIRVLAEHGGVAGLNFAPAFLDARQDHPVSSVEAMCRHVLHMMNKGGQECIAIGTDFDGIRGTLEIPECTQMERLFDALKKAGVHEGTLDRFMYGNAMRVLKDTLK